MISARGPNSASAEEPGIDVRAPLLRVARQTPRPLHPCRPASAAASIRAVGLAPDPFPSGLLPSSLGMEKPTISQARDRAEVLLGRCTPGMGHERRFPGTSNGRPKRARNVRSRSRVRIARSLVELPERVDFSRSDANGWMATSGTNAKCKSVQVPRRGFRAPSRRNSASKSRTIS